MNILNDLGISYKTEFFAALRYSDFYLDKLNIIIELDGNYHFY